MTVGGLNDLESSLDRFRDRLESSSVVARVIDRCGDEAPGRRLLRFFSWARDNLFRRLEDRDFNHAIRGFALRKDHTAMGILMSDLAKDGRLLDQHTFGVLAEALVLLGRDDEALGIFKNLERFSCPRDSEMVVSIITALCLKGHAKKAEGVLRHHRSKLENGMIAFVYTCLLHGWRVKEDPKEARRIIKEMRLDGIAADIFCFNTFLKCFERITLRRIHPDTCAGIHECNDGDAELITSFRTALATTSCSRAWEEPGGVKELCRVLDSMMKSGCDPNWCSYYLVVRALYLSGRFGKGNDMVDEIIARGLVPEREFYYDLVGILCGVERANHTLNLFKRMKSSGERQKAWASCPSCCQH